jgi:hypothetical protein
METCRVLIISDHPLFAEGVSRLIDGHAGLQVIGVIPAGTHTSAGIQASQPDVVVVDMDVHNQAEHWPDWLHDNAGVKFISLSLNDDNIRVYYQRVKKSTGVDALVEAIREPLEWRLPQQAKLRILAITQGRYGQRVVENVCRHAPAEHWQVQEWVVPSSLPSVVDEVRDFLPPKLAASDLILSMGESPSVAVLLPDVVKMTGARAVIAPVSNGEWLPSGLMNQVHEWLARMGVAVVFPKPFCSLVEDAYSLWERKVSYTDGPIGEFARHFGRPSLLVSVDETGAVIRSVSVVRDSACGCARHVASHLAGVPLAEAEERAGLLHHHFPCLASMTIDPDYNDALINVSGHILREELARQLSKVNHQESQAVVL